MPALFQTSKCQDSTAKLVKVLPTIQIYAYPMPLHTQGLDLLIQRIPFMGDTIGYWSKKYQIYQQRHFHYITLLVQQRPISFMNILFDIHHKITSNKWSSVYQQRYILESHYIKLWQRNAPSSHGNPMHIQSHDNPMHHTSGIFAI